MTKTRANASGIAIAVSLVFSVPAFAQTPAAEPATKSAGKPAAASSQATGSAKAPSTLATQDRDFMVKAAESDIAEIQSGQAAKSKATSDAVKSFADRMVTDHTKTSEQLKNLASKRNVQLPAAPARKHEREMKRLAEKSGADFDRAYMASQVSAHRDAVNLFQKESKSGKDAELKSFATATLPALQEHLKMAQDLEKEVRSAGNKTTAATKK